MQRARAALRAAGVVQLERQGARTHGRAQSDWAGGQSLLGLFDAQPQGTEECDVAVIGGGSGGIACANRLAELGKSVVLFDQVRPSPKGTTWGFGGTCVNVGCIPKKLFHEAATLRMNWLHDAGALGMGDMVGERSAPVDWARLRETIQNFVKSLNFSYSAGLREGVALVRSAAALEESEQDGLGVRIAFLDPLDGSRRETRPREGIVIACGGRPSMPSEAECPGALEFGITSDDIFSLAGSPGRTLCVGGGYVSTEIASFLAGLGNPVTQAVRSTLLRGDGFDAHCVGKVAEMVKADGVQLALGAKPIAIERGETGLRVTLASVDREPEVFEFDTVLFGTGRTPDLGTLKLERVGVKVRNSDGKIAVDDDFRTSRDGVFAVGDAAATGAPELTPVAVRQGEILAEALAGRPARSLLAAPGIAPNELASLMVPSTVFAAAEYGRVGLSQAAAERAFGKADVESYIMEWQSLLPAATHRMLANGQDFPHRCLAKLVCVKSQDERVVGLHYVGPSAGEVVQGFALAVNLGATKRDFDSRVLGIHPTDAEALVGLTVTVASGEDFRVAGGCGGGRCG